MYKVEIGDEELFKSDNFEDIIKFLIKKLDKSFMNKCYQEFYGNGKLIEWYYVPYNKSLVNVSIIDDHKINVVELLKKSKKTIRLNKDVSLIPKKKYYTRKCPQTDPDFYNDENYVRRGFDGYLWMTKKKNNKYIWIDYISPL